MTAQRATGHFAAGRALVLDEAVEDIGIEIAVTNDLREISGVAAKIDEFCAAREFTPQIGYAVNLAVDEILTNTISYGYEDEEVHRIELIPWLKGENLVIVIVDDSRAFHPSLANQPDLALSIED